MIVSVFDENGKVKEANLYSPQGIELLTELWIKSSFYHKIMYEPTWLGVPVIQYPGDIVMMQELIWRVRPDLIVETGVAHGGGCILYASILQLLGRGKVIGIDVDIRKYNSIAIKSHPLSRRIELITGSSTDPVVIQDVARKVDNQTEVLVVLDSNHSYEHVLEEMRLYSRFVLPGGYMVVMDGVQQMLGDTPSGKTDWKQDNPLRAIEEFLVNNSDWEVDTYYTRTLITCNPKGFLRRKG